MHPSQLSLHQMVVDYSCSHIQRLLMLRCAEADAHICWMWISDNDCWGWDAWELALLRCLINANRRRLAICICAFVFLFCCYWCLLFQQRKHTTAIAAYLAASERARGGGGAFLVAKSMQYACLVFCSPKVYVCLRVLDGMWERMKACRTDLKLVGNEKWLWSCVSGSVLGNCQRCREL